MKRQRVVPEVPPMLDPGSSNVRILATQEEVTQARAEARREFERRLATAKALLSQLDLERWYGPG